MKAKFSVKAKLWEAKSHISSNTTQGISHYKQQVLGITKYYKETLNPIKIN